MIRKIINKLYFFYLRSKIQGLGQFNKILSHTKVDQKVLALNRERLQPTYQYYVQHISQADMAASLELAAFVLSICQVCRFKKLLDLGSGFSSFVFRLYAKENPSVVVYSVDDDAAWLEKTKSFLSQHQLNTENIYTLDDFLKLNEKNFDCVLHDLNFVEVRINYVQQVYSFAKNDGLIIWDDVHKPDYLYPLLKQLNKHKATTYSLKPPTLDSFGRYAFATIKK